MKKTPLGKGLGALLAGSATLPAARGTADLPLDAIVPNRYQPRQDLSEEGLQGLVQSVRQNGLLQPVVVRRTPAGYELVAGERRWRAAKLAGLKTIPVLVRDASGSAPLELALVENLQRSNLNPIEEAKAYHMLVYEFHIPQHNVADTVGRDRATVSNSLRLLQLPSEVQDDLKAGRLNVGHAKALLMVDGVADQLTLWRRIRAEQLSVRQVEASARGLTTRRRQAAPHDPHLAALVERVQYHLSTKVEIHHGPRGGRMVLRYGSLEELDRIIGTMLGSSSQRP